MYYKMNSDGNGKEMANGPQRPWGVKKFYCCETQLAELLESPKD